MKSVAESPFARAFSAAQGNLGLPGNFSRLGPAQKIRRLAECSAGRSAVLRYLNTGAQVNMLHQVQDSLKSVASGIQ